MGRAIVRSWTLLTKELMEVLRQPLLVLSLVLGPFLILLVFALGHRSQQPPLTAVLSLPTTINLSRDVSFWHDRFGGGVAVVAVTDNEASARGDVEAGRADLALIIPTDAYTAVTSGRQAQVRVLYNQINPVDQAYTGFIAYVLSSELNKQVITEAAHQAQIDLANSRQPLANLRQDVATIPNVPADRQARIKSDLDRLESLSTRLEAIPPGVLAAPLASQVVNVSPIDPGYVEFYSPGVLALLLQHLAITFAALSFVRDRLVGMTEMYKVAPTSTFSVLVGKYGSYGLLCLAVGGILTLLMVRVLGVPLLGDPVLYWGTLALLVFASLGIGSTFSLLSASQENAVQLTMLVLLASVFFSGFFLPISAFQPPATYVSVALPVTHGILALQDLMLRGHLSSYQPMIFLGWVGLLFFAITTHLLNRELRRS